MEFFRVVDVWMGSFVVVVACLGIGAGLGTGAGPGAGIGTGDGCCVLVVGTIIVSGTL